MALAVVVAACTLALSRLQAISYAGLSPGQAPGLLRAAAAVAPSVAAMALGASSSCTFWFASHLLCRDLFVVALAVVLRMDSHSPVLL